MECTDIMLMKCWSKIKDVCTNVFTEIDSLEYCTVKYMPTNQQHVKITAIHNNL